MLEKKKTRSNNDRTDSIYSPRTRPSIVYRLQGGICTLYDITTRYNFARTVQILRTTLCPSWRIRVVLTVCTEIVTVAFFFFLCCLRPQAQIRGSRVAHLQGRGQVVEFRLQAVRHERGARRHDRSAEHQVRVLRIVRVLFFFQSL